MGIASYISRRYLFSRKNKNVINLITGIAMGGIAVGTAALILVLSVFNGLNQFIEDIYAAMDPDLKIVAAEGKYLAADTSIHQLLLHHEDIAVLSRTIEGKIGLKYREIQTFGMLKGVEKSFPALNDIGESMVSGSFNLTNELGLPTAILGYMVSYRLHAPGEDQQEPIELLSISSDRRRLTGNIFSSAKVEPVFPAGVFSIQKEYDEQLVLADFSFSQEFLELEGKLSSYEIGLKEPDKDYTVKKKLEKILPPELLVQTWEEQHPSLYRVMRSEKFISYLILTLMIALAAINILGSLSMIILEKTQDIGVLRSMGATKQQIRQIFLYEGFLVGGIGVAAGMLVGFILGLLQQEYGLVKLSNGASFRVQAYPLQMHTSDFLLIFVTVMVFTVLAAIYPARKAATFEIVESLSK